MGRFDGQRIVVTGASRGLGRVIAVAFAREGGYVYLTYLARESDARDAIDEVRQAGGEGELLPFDVSDRRAVDEAFRQVAARGRIDVLVNNAAIASDAPATFVAVADWDDVLRADLSGVFHCSSVAAEIMMAQREGAIVNIASVAGVCASPGQASYSAAKGGVVALTRTLAAEWASRGIRVNAVVPGLLDTGMAARLDRRILAKRVERIPLARVGRAEEVAEVVLFVASRAASYLVGQAIVVDGGLTL